MMSESQLSELRERVWRCARRRLGGIHQAEDLAQDVMLKLHMTADRPSDPRRLLSWALRVARNRIIDQYRAGSARRSVSLDVELPSVERQASAETELAGCITPMLRHLPETYREAVELSELQGHSQQAVADRLGLSLSGAKSRVQRGRERLKQMMERCCVIERAHDGGIIDFEPGKRAMEYCGGVESEESCVHLGD